VSKVVRVLCRLGQSNRLLTACVSKKEIYLLLSLSNVPINCFSARLGLTHGLPQRVSNLQCLVIVAVEELRR
jgi:hypothetical protein